MNRGATGVPGGGLPNDVRADGYRCRPGSKPSEETEVGENAQGAFRLFEPLSLTVPGCENVSLGKMVLRLS